MLPALPLTPQIRSSLFLVSLPVLGRQSPGSRTHGLPFSVESGRPQREPHSPVVLSPRCQDRWDHGGQGRSLRLLERASEAPTRTRDEVGERSVPHGRKPTAVSPERPARMPGHSAPTGRNPVSTPAHYEPWKTWVPIPSCATG